MQLLSLSNQELEITGIELFAFHSSKSSIRDRILCPEALWRIEHSFLAIANTETRALIKFRGISACSSYFGLFIVNFKIVSVFYG